MCDELPLEYEQPFIDILNEILKDYLDPNHTPNDIVSIITSYLFCNEYYFRRDCHIIDIVNHTITLYLYHSKFCINLFKLECPIGGDDFLNYIDSIYSVESTPNTTITNNNAQTTNTEHVDKANPIKAWIDTECKDDAFSNSKSANMRNQSYFLMMTYFEESRQNITPWLVQWRYDNTNNSTPAPYIQVIARIISYPSDWNYVTLTYKDNVSAIFYTSQEQHTIHFEPHSNPNDAADGYSENVAIIKFGNGLNYPWLMFGSAATKVLAYSDILLLFGNESSELLNGNINLQRECEYFVTRSCKNFTEMRDHGAFWTTSRDHICIFQITEKRASTKTLSHDLDEKKEEEVVDFNVQSQFAIFNNVDNEGFNANMLDVTVTKNWSNRFQRKYDIKYNHKLFMILYTEIRHDIKTTDLYASYLSVLSGKVERLKTCQLASSKCLTKFLVGRGSYQTVRNDWLLIVIGVDENNREVRNQLRLTEELELLYYQRVKRNENVQEVTKRYECKALKYFRRAKKEELEMQKANQPQTTITMQTVWRNIVASRHLILSTIVGAYIGWRVSRAVRNGQWGFTKFIFSNS